MTVKRLTLHLREHARTPDIVDDCINAEGALRPLLAPLRVHRGSVRTCTKELLVEQDAVGELHCGSTQPGCLDNQMATAVQCFPSFNLPEIIAKKKKQLVIMMSAMDRRSATPGLQQKNSVTGAQFSLKTPQTPQWFCMVDLPTYALSSHHHPGHIIIECQCCAAMSHPVCRTRGRSSQQLHGAYSRKRRVPCAK